MTTESVPSPHLKPMSWCIGRSSWTHKMFLWFFNPLFCVCNIKQMINVAFNSVTRKKERPWFLHGGVFPPQCGNVDQKYQKLVSEWLHLTLGSRNIFCFCQVVPFFPGLSVNTMIVSVHTVKWMLFQRTRQSLAPCCALWMYDIWRQPCSCACWCWLLENTFWIFCFKNKKHYP